MYPYTQRVGRFDPVDRGVRTFVSAAFVLLAGCRPTAGSEPEIGTSPVAVEATPPGSPNGTTAPPADPPNTPAPPINGTPAPDDERNDRDDDIPSIRPGTWEVGVDRPGSDLRNFTMTTLHADECAEACRADPACRAFTVAFSFGPPMPECWLKSAVPEPVAASEMVSGVLTP